MQATSRLKSLGSRSRLMSMVCLQKSLIL
ncbi:hypothetical protein AKJ16_DCAP27713 [Drosera capensis]